MTKQSEMAQKVLDQVTATPENFDMDWFITLGPVWDDKNFLEPVEEVSCETTMCAAGWAAHFDGWTLYPGGATKSAQTYPLDTMITIEEAGAQAFDMAEEDPHALFFTNEDIALRVLRRMAAGERYYDNMVIEEGNK